MNTQSKENKPVLHILPGWGGSHETWATFVALAKGHFEVNMIDLPCFGGIPCPETVWGVDEYAQFVKNRMANNGASRRILLGHSFGGQLAAYLAATDPDICNKLILVAPAVVREKRFFRRIFFGGVAKTGKLLFRLPFIERFDLWAKKILYRATDSPDYKKTSGIQTEIYKKIIRQDMRVFLTNIRQPTLVVWGTRDKMTPFRHAKKIMPLLAHGTLAVVKGGTHGLHHEPFQKELFEYIRHFANES